MKKIKLVFAVILLFPYSLFSQKENIVTSQEYIQQGIKLHDEEDYEGAIKKFKQVTSGDSLYTLAMYEQAYSLYMNKKYEECIAICDEALLYPENEYEMNFWVQKGNSLDELKKFEEALASYDHALKKYPYSTRLLINKGISYDKNEKTQEAIKIYKKILELNPNTASAHYRLGQIAYNEDKPVECFLSLTTFLLLEQNTQRSNNALFLLDNFAGNKSDGKKQNVTLSPEGSDGFDDVEGLFRNRIALNKNYKIPTQADQDIMKQLHLILTQIKYDPAKKGFWNTFYVPFYEKLMKEDQYEGLTYTMLKSSTNKNIEQLAIKKSKVVSEFLTWAIAAWQQQHLREVVEKDGKKITYAKMADGGTLTARGPINETNNVGYGTWEYYDKSGYVSTIMNFNANGDKEGEFVQFSAPNRKSISGFLKANELNGLAKIYFNSGQVKETKNFEKGKLVGERILYYPSGKIYAKMNYNKESQLDGPADYFYENGKIRDKVIYKNGLREGKGESYNPQGILLAKINYLKDKLEGDVFFYNHKGKIKAEKKYKADFYNGIIKEYNSKGILINESNYAEGILVGKSNTFYNDGAKKTELELDEKGKQNGFQKYYDYDGKLYLQNDFKKGNYAGYKYFDKEGKIISEATLKGNQLPYKAYTADGTLQSEGLYKDSNKEGEWKYYDNYGNLESKVTYVKDKMVGTLYNYFENGNVKEEMVYKDGLKHGKYTQYYINGKIQSEGQYYNDLAYGEWKFYNQLGKMYRNSFYENDELNGIANDYFPNSKIKSRILYEGHSKNKTLLFDTSGVCFDTIQYSGTEGIIIEKNPLGKISAEYIYHNGDIDGQYKSFYGDGTLHFTKTFIEGQAFGEAKIFHPNKKLAHMYYTLNDEKDSIETFYNTEGIKTDEYLFSEDLIQGKYHSYDDKGNLDTEGEYVDGKRNGKWTYYSSDKEIYMIRYYDHGKWIGYSYMDKTNKELPMIKIKEADNTITTYFSNGNKAFEAHYNKGLFQGSYTIYYSNAKKMVSKTFKDDEETGTTEKYFTNGKLQSTTEYLFDLKHGKSIEYNDAGVKISESNYYLSDLHGESITYDKAGKVLNQSQYYYGDLIP